MKITLKKFNLRANVQIEKEMLEREIVDAQNALEWALRI